MHIFDAAAETFQFRCDWPGCGAETDKHVGMIDAAEECMATGWAFGDEITEFCDKHLNGAGIDWTRRVVNA